MRLLVVRLSALGDVLLAAAALEALRARFPDATIDFCTSPAYAPLFAGHPALGEVLTLGRDEPAFARGRALAARRYDVVVDLQHKVRTGLFCRGVRATRRLVFVKRRGRDLWRGLLGRPLRPGAHTATLYLRALGPLGVDADAVPRPRLAPPPAALATVDAWLDAAGLGATGPDDAEPQGAGPDLGLADRRPFVALAPGAAHATKRWPLASFVALAAALRARGLAPLAIGGPPDAALLDALAAAGVPAAPADWPLTALAALLARARALVCGDTGPAHLAAAVGTPVLALFGPTDPVRWAPLVTPHRVLTRGLPCAPCSDHGGARCPLGTHACLAELPPAAVADALSALLAQARP